MNGLRPLGPLARRRRFGPPGPGLVTTGLELWFKAGRLSAGRPTTLPDDSPAGRTIALSAESTTAALYESASINGLPSLFFDGIDPGQKQSYEIAWPVDASDGHLFAVVKAGADPHGAGVDSASFFQAGASGLGCFYPWVTGDVYDDFGRTAREQFNPTPSLDAWNIVELISSASAWECLINGASVHSAGAGTRGWASTALIGSNAIGYAFRGRLAELGVYKAALSGPDIDANLAYLSDKYAITVA